MIVRTLLLHQKILLDRDGCETPKVKTLASYYSPPWFHLTRNVSDEHDSCETFALWCRRFDWNRYHQPVAKFCFASPRWTVYD
jgi:hypothetical protein